MADTAWAQAQTLQAQMEGPLLKLEKLGALTVEDADEIRNIVAEGIADKFNKRYRAFPGEREGVEIRRNMVPKECVLKKRSEAYGKATAETRRPPPLAVAKPPGNKAPAKPQATRGRRAPVTFPRGADFPQKSGKQQPVPKGSWYRKPAAPEESIPASSSSKKSSPEKRPAQAGRVMPADKLHKNWQNGLASSTSQVWNDILATPNAVLSTLPGSDNSSRAQSSATTVDQRVASPVSTKDPATHAVLDTAKITTSGEATADIDLKSVTEGVVVGVKDDGVGVMGNSAVSQSDLKLAEDEDDGVAVKIEEHDSAYVLTCFVLRNSQLTDPVSAHSSSKPTIDFGDDLIWLGD
ncbi:hypothetical protein VPNG_04520 [Cytospora leucostoma]|uniref:Uncharacterized protein n=1 Tax=Cytospora leucostoma TaxID=1230097 RepID=A0A423XCA8_9PEZI|nr:hypothetical protein VPNG_04520 [Cytospora leucostoma]